MRIPRCVVTQRKTTFTQFWVIYPGLGNTELNGQFVTVHALYRPKSRMTWLWTINCVGYGRTTFRPPSPPSPFSLFLGITCIQLLVSCKIWGCHDIDYERTFLWGVTPWSLAHLYRQFRETWWWKQQVFLKCRYISDYTASRPRHVNLHILLLFCQYEQMLWFILFSLSLLSVSLSLWRLERPFKLIQGHFYVTTRI